MREILIKTKEKDYFVILNTSYEGLLESLPSDIGSVFIVSDETVAALYKDEVISALSKRFKEINLITFPPGEKSKNLSGIERLYSFFMEKGMDRKSAVLALGGGVCGDIAGFAAATFMRGVRLIQLPTTLLSQTDSSVGGKTGVDYKGNKNIIGAFYQPDLVYINTETLKTLPVKEFNAGLAEVIKYGVISDAGFFSFIFDNKEKIRKMDNGALNEIIGRSCEIKGEVVSADEKESGLREILNFGHTAGHAIETLSGFSLLHGECVSIGMVGAMYASYKRGYIGKEELTRLSELLKFFDLPVKAFGLSPKDIYSQMLKDKKTKDRNMNFVLIKSFGKAAFGESFSEKEIFDMLFFIIEE